MQTDILTYSMMQNNNMIHSMMHTDIMINISPIRPRQGWQQDIRRFQVNAHIEGGQDTKPKKEGPCSGGLHSTYLNYNNINNF